MRVMKRHIPLKIFLCILGVILLLAAFFVVRAVIHKRSPESYGSYTFDPDMPFDLSLFDGQNLYIDADAESLRIMQIADPQIKFGFMTHDKKTMDLLDRAIASEKPDICVVTGDLTMSLFTYDAYKYFAEFMEEREQYWTLTYGNHDLEFDSSAYTLSELLKDYRYCLFDKGPENVKGESNFLVNVYLDGEDVPSYSLIMLDSGMYPEDGGGLSWVYDSFGEDQLAFYKWAVEGLQKENSKIKTSLFFHIPVQEYASMYYAAEAALGHEIAARIDPDTLFEVREVTGTVCENDKDPEECVDEGYTVGIYYQGENTGLYALACELGSTHAMFVGHDHANTLRGYYGDIYLAYGRCTGYHTYPLFEKENFLTKLLGLGDDIYFNMEHWVDESGTPYEKGVVMIEVDLTEESYGALNVYDRADSDYK